MGRGVKLYPTDFLLYQRPDLKEKKCSKKSENKAFSKREERRWIPFGELFKLTRSKRDLHLAFNI